MAHRKSYQWEPETSEEEPQRKSRSQKKRESTALQNLGEEIAALPMRIIADFPALLCSPLSGTSRRSRATVPTADSSSILAGSCANSATQLLSRKRSSVTVTDCAKKRVPHPLTIRETEARIAKRPALLSRAL